MGYFEEIIVSNEGSVHPFRNRVRSIIIFTF